MCILSPGRPASSHVLSLVRHHRIGHAVNVILGAACPLTLETWIVAGQNSALGGITHSGIR
jgi:hypothetical protein